MTEEGYYVSKIRLGFNLVSQRTSMQRVIARWRVDEVQFRYRPHARINSELVSMIPHT
jgi:hypothetical protein